MNKRWAKLLIAIGAAAFVGLTLTLELYFNNRAVMMAVDLFDLGMPQFVRGAMWAALAPLILRLCERVPLSRGKWAGGIGFHLLASFLVMATYYLGRIWGYTLFWPEEATKGFWKMALDGFFGHNLVDMAYYWAMVALGYGLEIQQRLKSEEVKAAQLETKLIETELNALRQQMHPHFLFNTMNTIAVLVREGRNDDAVTLLSRLSSLLRMSLDNTGVPEVTLQQELDFLAHYIEIQQARFSDRLTVEVAVAPEALGARIPNLLLQPIVENAILHGVAPKTGPGRVEILGRIEADRLLLEVRDDGPGIVDGRARAREGVGLANTRERLAKIYGARSQLLLHSEPGRGVTVKIVVPFRT
ncbi:MAG TPA: histidine kinase [Opitutus sp.]|nr:histidine kinase [Opitutus sp.]